MLSKLITTVNWRILKFLADREASLSEIAEKTKTTKANTFYSLKEMEKMDVVRKTVQGRTHVYRFNFLHPEAENISGLIEEEGRLDYNNKIKNVPNILHSFLSVALKTNYKGCTFFGSSLEGSFNDIDVFILLKERKNTTAIEKKIRLIDKRISPIFGSLKELESGIKKEDMLYKNILRGISFGVSLFSVKHRAAVLRRADIRERFIMGYREVLSCLEFTEKEYQRTHLEKGVMDFIYTLLNYFDISPKDDREAILLLKKLKETKPNTIGSALKLMEKYAWILS